MHQRLERTGVRDAEWNTGARAQCSGPAAGPFDLELHANWRKYRQVSLLEDTMPDKAAAGLFTFEDRSWRISRA
ncbi:hypothetical protein [Rhizobium sp. BK661]|uniref:hypothetical protein n=1 Tax=Rhizobium sp. BK661 TaxID=2586991 RepID=UPI002166E334|nr:hypothetical protein [Rhizobium sp. BK661]MCS3743459.1 hypothetical protein [Rhizobium sp. BK661]